MGDAVVQARPEGDRDGVDRSRGVNHEIGEDTHTLDPWKWPSSSWATSVWVLPEPVEVGPESALRACYHRRVAGKPDGLTVEVVDRRAG